VDVLIADFTMINRSPSAETAIISVTGGMGNYRGNAVLNVSATVVFGHGLSMQSGWQKKTPTAGPFSRASTIGPFFQGVFQVQSPDCRNGSAQKVRARLAPGIAR
jgi:hypothetical protein